MVPMPIDDDEERATPVTPPQRPDETTEWTWDAEPRLFGGNPVVHWVAVAVILFIGIANIILMIRGDGTGTGQVIGIVATLLGLTVVAQTLLPPPQVTADRSTLRLPRQHRGYVIPGEAIEDVSDGSGLLRRRTVIVRAEGRPIDTGLPAGHTGIRDWWAQVNPAAPPASADEGHPSPEGSVAPTQDAPADSSQGTDRDAPPST